MAEAGDVGLAVAAFVVAHGEVITKGNHILADFKSGCPGINFPWHVYELASLALTPAAVPEDEFRATPPYGIAEGAEIDRRDKDAVKELSRDLHTIGYALNETGSLTESVKLAVRRFQARYMNGNRPSDFIGGPALPGFKTDLKWTPSGTVDWRTAIQIKRVLRSLP